MLSSALPTRLMVFRSNVHHFFAGDASSALHECPEGYYCVNGTGHNPQPCPSGSYSNVTGLSDISHCTVCDPGMYCQGKLRNMF